MAWFGHLIEIARFFASQDARSAVASLGEKISPRTEAIAKRTVQKVSIEKGEQNRLIDVVDALALKLEEDEATNEAIFEILTCFGEMTQNAFDHGCSRDDDKVDITINHGSVTLSLSVKQPNPLPNTILRARNLPAEAIAKKFLEVGHGGLEVIAELADSIRIVGSSTIVTFHLKKPRNRVISSRSGGHSSNSSSKTGFFEDPPYILSDGRDDIYVYRKEDVNIIRLHGSFLANDRDALHSVFSKHVGDADLIIAFEGVKQFTSGPLGSLILAVRGTAAAGFRVVLVSPPSPFVIKVLQTASDRTDTVTESTSVEAALASLRHR